MAAKDRYHRAVVNALQKAGWIITHDPFRLEFGESDLFVDLGAERIIAAEKGVERIAVEVKSFLGESEITELERAVGQYVLYRFLMSQQAPDRKLWLAVPQLIVTNLIEERTARQFVDSTKIAVIGFDPKQEEITTWIS